MAGPTRSSTRAHRSGALLTQRSGDEPPVGVSNCESERASEGENSPPARICERAGGGHQRRRTTSEGAGLSGSASARSIQAMADGSAGGVEERAGSGGYRDRYPIAGPPRGIAG